MERLYDAVMPTILELIAGFLIIGFAMLFLIVATGGCPPKRKD